MAQTKTMFEIDDKVVSLDIIRERFKCDIQKCRGCCCVHGESGAPLEEEEVLILNKIFPLLRHLLREEAIRAIKEQGTSVVDEDKEWVTPLVNKMECAYAVFEDGIARCAIEKAFEAGVTDFRKPLSCHLYPVRIKKYDNSEAVNYDHWQICDSAREKGNKLNVPVYLFIKDALIRRYGKDFTDKLTVIAREIEDSKEIHA